MIRAARRFVLSLSLIIAAANVTRAETLEDAWSMALLKDQGLAAVRSQAEAAALEADAARAQRWPSLSVSGSYSKLDDSPAFEFGWAGLAVAPPELFEDDQIVVGTASVALPLFTSGRISGGIKAAEARQRVADAQISAAVSDLKLAVAVAYVDVIRARRAHDVARSNVQSLDALASDTSSMYERELVPKNELLTAQVALADAKQNELRTRNAAEVALAAYNRRLGLPMTRPADLAEPIHAPVEVSRSVEELTEQAVGRRAELSALDAQAEALGQLARTERSRALPQVALTGGYQHLENQFLDDDTVAVAGIGVQWALFDGGVSRKRAAALEHSRKATEQQHAETASLIALQVREAWLGLSEARQRVQVTKGAAEQADESVRIARERYSAGLGTQTQLLEAEALRVQALKNRDDAVLDATLAELRVARAAGIL
jgi:outer membrane protein TolC